MVKSIGLSVQEKKRKMDFKDSHHGGHLGFPIETILAIFDLQVTPMRPTKFPVNWHIVSGEEAKKKKIFKNAATSDILDIRSARF